MGSERTEFASEICLKRRSIRSRTSRPRCCGEEEEEEEEREEENQEEEGSGTAARNVGKGGV